MKLRNKKTGEVVEYTGNSPIDLFYHDGDLNLKHKQFNSIAELNEEWEDYEEPKEYWFIRDHTSAVGYAPADNNATAKYRKEIIGNYFETKEEAEKAVDKLKAWKRLKDFGCGFMVDDHFTVKFVAPDARKITSAEEQKSLSDAYKFLFGGEK